MIATGSGREPRQAAGSWVSYGLGTENENLPAFIEIMPGQPRSTPSAFLPAIYGSTAIGRTDTKGKDRVWDNLSIAGPASKAQRKHLDLVQAMNRDYESRIGAEHALDAEVQAMELAFRMQSV